VHRQPHVRLARNHGFYDCPGQAVANLKNDGSVVLQEPCDRPWQQDGGDRWQRRDHHAAAPAFEELGEVPERRIEFRDQTLGDRTQLASRGRELDAPRGAIEHSPAQRLLHRLNRAAQARLRNALQPSCVAEAARVR
jgi:hypothetical protein